VLLPGEQRTSSEHIPLQPRGNDEGADVRVGLKRGQRALQLLPHGKVHAVDRLLAMGMGWGELVLAIVGGVGPPPLRYNPTRHNPSELDAGN